MFEIRPVADLGSHVFVDKREDDSSLKKVWNAVVEFFTQIVRYISESSKTIWGNIKNVIGLDSSPITKDQIAPPPATTLESKLALYRNMPCDAVSFIEKSIQIYKNHLQAKEEANIAALPAGAPIPAEQRPLHTFNEEWETLMNIPLIALAIIRGYVFSDCRASARQIPFFSQVVGREPGDYDPPAIDPETGQLLHNGGYEMRDRHEDRTVVLRALRVLFNELDDREKEIVLNKTDFGKIDEMPISQNAKDVLDGIARIAHLLHQHNANFMKALQVVYGRRGAG